MKITAIAFTQNGAGKLDILKNGLGAQCYAIQKYARGDITGFENLSALLREMFSKTDAFIFVGACGIAVRAIAPYVRDKSKDPAVVVMDEMARFVIPILSGHIGGANDLAVKAAELTGAEPVITTATDINDAFAVDTFAVKNNLHIGDTKLIKEISSRVLRGHKIGLFSDCELNNIPDCFCENAEAGIYIGDGDKSPFRITLKLIPKTNILGIGCKKNCENVEESILAFLKVNGVSVYSLREVATIDIKKHEQGILDFCDKYSLPLKTFSSEELSAQQGEFCSSDFVEKTVGVDNVCERAVCASGAKLCVKKTPLNGTALALGSVEADIDFLRGNK